MIRLLPEDIELSVLCLGAHPDDIEIGCGGTLLALAERPGTQVSGVVLTGTQERTLEAQASLPKYFPGCDVEVLDLPDGRLPAHWGEVKDCLEEIARERQPALVFAPRVDDAHQDHRLLGRLVQTVWRDSLVLHYEIPKWDGDLVGLTHYVEVSPPNAHRKVELLNESFPSQAHRGWWDDELFLGLMRLRGIESRSTYAEAFATSKVSLGLSEGSRP